MFSNKCYINYYTHERLLKRRPQGRPPFPQHKIKKSFSIEVNNHSEAILYAQIHFHLPYYRGASHVIARIGTLCNLFISLSFRYREIAILSLVPLQA